MADDADAYASIRAGYAAEGARGFYERHGDAYRNPHEPVVARLIEAAVADWPLDLSHVLDLAAGSGEVTLAILSTRNCGTGFQPASSDARSRVGSPCHDSLPRIDAVDPYTAAAYAARTGRPCEELSFEDVAAGALSGRDYSLVVCSFALHLAAASRLPTLCWRLAECAGQLLVLTPHKRPTIDAVWGWRLTHERVIERVRARLYAVQPAVKGLS